MNNQIITLDVMAGTQIHVACEKAIRTSNATRKDVRFVFNGTEILCKPFSKIEDLVQTYDIESTRAYYAYKSTDEYKIKQEQRTIRLAQIQGEIDCACEILRNGCRRHETFESGHPWFVRWVAKFVRLNDDCDLSYDKANIVSCLEMAGYIENECTGEDFVADDKNIFARWLIGQAIQNLKSGMPIHPIAAKFADDYFKIT